MDYKVHDDPSVDREAEFCKLCPVTDPMKPSSIHTKIPFAHGCMSKTACKADLQIQVESLSMGRPMILNEDTRLNLNVTVSNMAEPAYLSKLYVTFPRRNMLFKVPRLCYQYAGEDSKSLTEHFICNLANPLGNTVKKVSILFEVDLSRIDVYTTDLSFNFTAWSASEETTPENNIDIVTVEIALVRQVVIRGNTNQRNIILTSKNPVAPTIPVIHKYEVVNYGPSPVGEFKVEFKIPVAFIQEPNSKPIRILTFPDPQMIVDGHIFRCNVDHTVTNDSTSFSQTNSKWIENAVKPELDLHVAAESNQRKRKRRSVEDWFTNFTETEHLRNALQLNCSEEDPNVVCIPITCTGGPLTTSSMADINLELYFNTSVIETLIDKWEAVEFQTLGVVDIVDSKKYKLPHDPRNQVSCVETEFMGEIKGDVLPSWILPLSIALGLLMILTMTKGLSNVGFFKREHREKLELMREKVAAEEEFPTTVENLADLSGGNLYQ